MRTHHGFSITVLFTLGISLCHAQEDSTNGSSVQPAPKPLQWNAELDAYTLGNFNGPASDTNTARSFDTHSDAFRLGAVSLDLNYQTSYFHAHLTGGYGDQFTAMGALERLKGANSYLSQYYVTYQPIKNTGLLFDFGKFYTSVGAEVADSQANFNYSRSLLFTLGEPLYHFGLRATVPVTQTFTVGSQVLNGWNDVRDNNSGKTFGFTSTLTKTKWSWSQAYLVGPEKNLTNQGKRQLINETATFTPTPALSSYIELLYGRDKRVGIGGGADAWYGVAAAVRWNWTKKFSTASRLEYYVDQSGFTSGTAQHLKEATATVGYALHSPVTTRLEYREDFSNRNYFVTSHDGLKKQQGTITLAFLFSLKGER